MQSFSLSDDGGDQQHRFHFVGNSLWLDFVNTEAIHEGAPVDLIPDFAAFTSWMSVADVLEASQPASLGERWNSVSESAMAEVRDFRRLLRDLAGGMAMGRTANVAEIGAVNDRLAQSSFYNKLEPDDCGFHLDRAYTWHKPTDLLTPIAQSVADLLAAGDSGLVRKCDSPTCILYFYDTTKNHARRWCSMTGCGNRHKQSIHRQRNLAKSRQ